MSQRSAGKLAGKVAIVTGAGNGVGRGIALALADEGAAVVIAARSVANGEAVAREIERRGGQAIFVTCDVADRRSIDACVAAAQTRFGQIDVLVNNAVFGAAATSFMEHDQELWDASISVGLLGTFHFMQAVQPHMAGRGGRIINLGSAAGYQAWENWAAYAAVKEGIRAISKVAAREWGKLGITVNVICPFANSSGWNGYVAAYPAAAQAQLERTPLGRVGDCERDVGRTAVFLASEDAAFITGHTVPVDGGMAFLA